MQVARYVVDAVVLQGRSCREVARAHGVSKSWVAELVRRYRVGGDEAIVPRSKAPHTIPNRTSADVEDHIVRLRKQLADDGLDAGAHTINHHLSLILQTAPSVATIWRILKRRGFITPQPQKRPRSSWMRFEATLPNECWQSDMTHWSLSDGTHVEIVNFLDDYSRLIVASIAMRVATARAVVAVFHEAVKAYGLPASVLTDNGCIYTAAYRGGRAAMENELLSLGIVYKHSRPYHPQTCGKVERFHQTLKLFLSKQSAATTLQELQAHIDRFVAYYNDIRPHRAKDRMTPAAAYNQRDKARPIGMKIPIGADMRVRHDVVDKTGALTLRHRSKLHHIKIGRAFRGTRVIMLIDGLDIRVLKQNGEQIRALTLDPSRDYQGLGNGRWPRP